MLSGMISGVENFFFRRVSKNFLARLVGLKSVDELNSMLYTGMSKATLYNLEYSMMPYRYKHKVFLDRGHGSLLTEPERLLKEIELAYAGYDEDNIGL